MVIASPIVIDLGQVQDVHMDELLNGTGRLLEEVDLVVQLVKKRTSAGDDTRFLVPIVAVYSQPGHLDTGEQPPVDFKGRGQGDRARRKIARVLRF